MKNIFPVKSYLTGVDLRLCREARSNFRHIFYAVALLSASGCSQSATQGILQDQKISTSNDETKALAELGLIAPVLQNTKQATVNQASKQISYRISGDVTDVDVKKIRLELADGEKLSEKPLWVMNYRDVKNFSTVLSFSFRSLPEGDDISFRFGKGALTYANGDKSSEYLAEKSVDTKPPEPRPEKTPLLLDAYNLEIEMSEAKIEVVDKNLIKIIDKDGNPQGDFTIRSDDNGTLKFETMQPLKKPYYGLVFDAGSIKDASGNLLKQKIVTMKKNVEKENINAEKELPPPLITGIQNTNSKNHISTNKPVIEIEGPAGAQIEIFTKDGTLVGEGQLKAQTKGFFALSVALPNGKHTIIGRATKDGITSSDSNALSFVINIEMPNASSKDEGTESNEGADSNLLTSTIDIDQVNNTNEKGDKLISTIDSSLAYFVEDSTEFLTGIELRSDTFGTA